MGFLSNLADNLRSSNASLRFPLDKVETADDYMMFTVYKYKPPFQGSQCLDNNYGGIFSGYDVTGLGGGTDIEGTQYKKMVLYMPEDVGDRHSRTWSANSFTPAQRAGLRAAATVLDGAADVNSLGDAGRLAKRAITPAPGQMKDLVTAIAVKQGGQIAGLDGNVAMGGVVGQVLNPNIEVMFSEPGVREFRFNWVLVPRNERESRIIKEIIWQFKKASAPELNKSGWFLDVPHVFKIEYKTGSKSNHWLNKMKACALRSINVNYTANGSYSTLEDGAPTAVALTLDFLELKTILSDDFGNSFNSGAQYY